MMIFCFWGGGEVLDGALVFLCLLIALVCDVFS